MPPSQVCTRMTGFGTTSNPEKYSGINWIRKSWRQNNNHLEKTVATAQAISADNLIPIGWDPFGNLIASKIAVGKIDSLIFWNLVDLDLETRVAELLEQGGRLVHVG